MCGIVGILSKKKSTISKNILNANKQMKKRGPDDEGFILINDNIVDICYGQDTDLKNFKDKQNYYPIKDINDTFNNNYNIALGHRRLSIVDLSSHGHQPMCDEDEKYWIVFNGEVYNFKEIREELITLGHNFISDTDTEVILKSYIEWNENCLEKFNGMFAFAILNNENDEMFIARDRVGMKPLYYTLQDDKFIFASDIKTLIKSKLYKPEVNWEGVYHNFSFSMTPRPNTSFKDVYSLRQAHYMMINVKTLEYNTTEYWDIPTDIQDNNMTEDEAVKLLESELHKSIKYRLISDVDVGTFMSGGIDSTTISAMASKVHPNIKAFTLAFDKSISEFDELEEAKKTAKLNDMEHIISTLEADVVLKNIDNMVLGYEEPFYHLAANYAISEIVSNNEVKVVLNGIGGDELFAGYTVYPNVKRWKVLSKLNPILKYIPTNIHRKVGIAKDISNLKDIYQYYAHSYSTYKETDKKLLFKEGFDSLNEIKKQYKKENKTFADEIELLSYIDIKSYIGNHHVHRTDQFTMNFSIEGRFPFLDHNLIEKAFTIPSKYKLNNGIQKYVLRQVAKKYIAPECLSMEKKGFGLPLNYWIDNQLKDLVSKSIKTLKKRDLFKNDGIDTIMKKGTVTQKWQLVMFELWYKKFIVEKLEND